jgi:hypothetical protein
MPEPLEPPGAAVTGEEVIMAERNAALRTALAGLPASCQPLMERIRESSALLGLADTGGKRPGGDPGG